MQSPSTNCRRGGTLVEAIMAVAIVGVAMGVAVEGMAFLGAQKRVMERRMAALLELDEILERVATTPWEQLNADKIQRFELSEYFRARAPEAAIVVNIAEENGPPRQKRIAVALRWRTKSGDETSPQLVAFRFQRVEATP